MCVCMCLCVYMCLCVCVFMYVHVCAHMCILAHFCEPRERVIKSPADWLIHLATSHSETGLKCLKLKENDYIWKYLLISCKYLGGNWNDKSWFPLLLGRAWGWRSGGEKEGRTDRILRWPVACWLSTFPVPVAHWQGHITASSSVVSKSVGDAAVTSARQSEVDWGALASTPLLPKISPLPYHQSHEFVPSCLIISNGFWCSRFTAPKLMGSITT